GVFASSIEPKEQPLIGGAQKTPANVEYDNEIAKLQGEVTKFRERRHTEIRNLLQLPKVTADYLAVAQEARALKTDEEVKSLAQKFDLIGFVLGRWKGLLEKTAKTPDKIWAPWHAFVAKGADAFKDAKDLGDLHPLVAE